MPGVEGDRFWSLARLNSPRSLVQWQAKEVAKEILEVGRVTESGGI